MAKNNDIKFVRINGRIVPIKKKKEKFLDKSSTQAGIFIGSGSAAAALGGIYSGKKFKQAEKFSQMSFDFAKEKKGSFLPKGVKDISSGFAKARDKALLSKRFRIYSGIVGSSLISLGFNKGFEALGYEERTLKQEAAREAGAVVATAAVMRGFEKGSGQKFGIKSSFKIPESAKKVSKSILKAFAKKRLKF